MIAVSTSDHVIGAYAVALPVGVMAGVAAKRRGSGRASGPSVEGLEMNE